MANARGSTSPQFAQKLQEAQDYAYALLRLARGYAFKMHLGNIATLLDAHLPSNEQRPQLPSTNTSEEGDDIDEDLEAIQPWDHAGWMRLSLAPFDALEIIISFMTDRSSKYPLVPTTIKARILVSPLASGDMYPWRELMTNPAYFPVEVKDVYSSTEKIGNVELRDWLEGMATDAMRLETLSGLADSASRKWTNPSKRISSYVSVHGSVSKLAADGSLHVIEVESGKIDLNQTSRHILTLLEEWHESIQNYVETLAMDVGDLPLDRLESGSINLTNIPDILHAPLEEWYKGNPELGNLEKNICDDLVLLSDELRPPAGSGFTYLANLSKLHGATQFKGATHCEACLATFLDDTQNGTNSKYAEHLDTPPFDEILESLEASMFIHIYSLSDRMK